MPQVFEGLDFSSHEERDSQDEECKRDCGSPEDPLRP